MTSDKDTIRKEAIRHRDFIDPASEDIEAIVPLFFEEINPNLDKVVALYWPKGKEFDCSPLLEALLKKDVK